MSEDNIIKQLTVGIFRTRSITLATTLMCSDYPGVTLDQVIADEEWEPGEKPLCEFVLRVDAGSEGDVERWVRRYEAEGGLPVESTTEYDHQKKKLIDHMRHARAEVVQRLRR